MKGTLLTLLLAILILYLAMGGLVFHILEKDQEEYTRANTVAFVSGFLAQKPCMTEEDLEKLTAAIMHAYDAGVIRLTTNDTQTNWDLSGSTFFALTVLTTIGYGHIAPRSSLGKIFLTLYALVGIPLCLVVLGGTGANLTQQYHKLDRTLAGHGPQGNWAKVGRTLVLVLAGIILFILIPSAVFSEVEGWDFISSVYYTIVSLSTIGFGDYVPAAYGKGGMYRLCTGVWLICGLTWLACILTALSEFVKLTAHKAMATVGE